MQEVELSYSPGAVQDIRDKQVLIWKSRMLKRIPTPRALLHGNTLLEPYFSQQHESLNQYVKWSIPPVDLNQSGTKCWYIHSPTVAPLRRLARRKQVLGNEHIHVATITYSHFLQA